jgi:hypothetical protein
MERILRAQWNVGGSGMFVVRKRLRGAGPSSITDGNSTRRPFSRRAVAGELPKDE